MVETIKKSHNLQYYQDHLQTQALFPVIPYTKHALRLVPDSQIATLSPQLRQLDLDLHVGVLIVQENEQFTVLLPRRYLELYHYRGALRRYLHRQYTVVVADIVDFQDHQYVLLSRYPVLKREFKTLSQQTQAFNGTVMALTKFGAYLKVGNLSVLLPNRNFAQTKGIKVGDLFQVGDQIPVKVKRVVPDKDLIEVESVKKYTVQQSQVLKLFHPQDEVIATVRSISPNEVYVQIGIGVDALCNYPTFEIALGQKVRFRITQINQVKHRVRGKIIGEYDDYDEYQEYEHEQKFFQESQTTGGNPQ